MNKTWKSFKNNRGSLFVFIKSKDLPDTGKNYLPVLIFG